MSQKIIINVLFLIDSTFHSTNTISTDVPSPILNDSPSLHENIATQVNIRCFKFKERSVTGKVVQLNQIMKYVFIFRPYLKE